MKFNSSYVSNEMEVAFESDKLRKSRLVLSSIKAGLMVVHKSFGEGVVLKIRENEILVAFGKDKKVPLSRRI